MQQTPAIELVDVVRRFGACLALDSLRLRVERGELYGLVGPDGAGKTTAIRAMAGLLAPDSGRVRLLERDPLTDGRVRESLGLMPQQYSLYPDLSVAETLRFFARLNVLPKQVFRARAAELLAITRLERFQERRADALSGGMYKKLALACALLHRPQVLLLDEPSTGVDPVSRRELWALLHRLVEEGMTILVSTPYMDEAERCHRVGLVHRGRLIVDGAPKSLIAQLAAETYEVVGGARDALDALLATLPQVQAASPTGARLRLVVAPGGGAAVAAAVAPLGAELVATRADFEDLFLASVAGEAA